MENVKISTYRKVANRSTCYYSENQVFGGATNRDMSLTETCFYSQIHKLDFKSRLVTCPKYRYVGTFFAHQFHRWVLSYKRLHEKQMILRLSKNLNTYVHMTYVIQVSCEKDWWLVLRKPLTLIGMSYESKKNAHL